MTTSHAPRAARPVRLTVETTDGVLRVTLALPVDRATTVPLLAPKAGSQPRQIAAHEQAMIDRLIEACSLDHIQNDAELAALIDKIGLTLMQAFLDREGAQEAQ